MCACNAVSLYACAFAPVCVCIRIRIECGCVRYSSTIGEPVIHSVTTCTNTHNRLWQAHVCICNDEDDSNGYTTNNNNINWMKREKNMKGLICLAYENEKSWSKISWIHRNQSNPNAIHCIRSPFFRSHKIYLARRKKIN